MDHYRHFKFGSQINNCKYYPMDEKLSPREGAWSQDHFFLNFGTPSINTERVKLETSKLVYGYILASPISRLKNTPIGGVVRVQGQIFKIWDSLPKYGTGKARYFRLGKQIDLGKFHLIVKNYPIGAWSGSRGLFKFGTGLARYL